MCSYYSINAASNCFSLIQAGVAPLTMTVNIEEPLQRLHFLFSKIESSPKRDFLLTMPVFQLVQDLRLLRRAKVRSKVGGQYID